MGKPDEDAINQAAGQIVVLDAKLALANGGRRPLEFYRRAGEMIAKLPGGYDSSRIGELAKALKKQKAPGMGANNLYKMARFAAVGDFSLDKGFCKVPKIKDLARLPNVSLNVRILP